MQRLLASSVTTLVFLVVLLVAAGHVDYWQAWAYAGLSLTMNVATWVVLRGAPEVAKERLQPGRGAKSWDKALLLAGLVLNVVMLIVAGLDSGRFHFRPVLSFRWAIAGILVSLAGMSLFLWALKENRFFSSVVRVQADRGQTVCTTGPYRVLRHPGNAGMIVGTLGLPLLFTSAWSLIPALLFAALLVVRTYLEDRTLSAELSGYVEYRAHTRFRLVPGVW